MNDCKITPVYDLLKHFLFPFIWKLEISSLFFLVSSNGIFWIGILRIIGLFVLYIQHSEQNYIAEFVVVLKILCLKVINPLKTLSRLLFFITSAHHTFQSFCYSANILWLLMWTKIFELHKMSEWGTLQIICIWVIFKKLLCLHL